MKAPVGRSLHIGLNRISVDHYGVDGALSGCESDARDMEAIASARAFTTQKLLNEQATSEAVTNAIADAAAALRTGDLFLITYSGHGAQVPDTNNDEADGTNDDKKDETWVLYDRMLVDDELYALWGTFREAVRIAVISDSCHSGTVARDIFFEPEPIGRWKMLPRAAEKATYEKQKALYDGIQDANPQGDRVGVGASVILLSGCKDSQRSADGDTNGAYTAALLKTWANGTYAGGYRTFQDAIAQMMPPDQTPSFFPVGLASPLFEAQTPFTI